MNHKYQYRRTSSDACANQCGHFLDGKSLVYCRACDRANERGRTSERQKIAKLLHCSAGKRTIALRIEELLRIEEDCCHGC